MTAERIAIVGMACRYPDASTPGDLWENVLAQRQAFRRIPPERFDAAYFSSDVTAPDTTYSLTAAVLTGYEFDRAAFRVSRSTFESTDLAHWLALDVSAAALRDAGVDPDPASSGVIVGNTLTGDTSRAASLRLRWPYVRRVLESAIPPNELRPHLDAVERQFKQPFAAVTEDTLAGGLSNTIAGRICNYFGFHGGGFTVDGACASSLLAVVNACSALSAGDLDFALAGGVDVSLDPFELIGFAKCSALAREAMYVYDRRANGFLPGEGCGFVALMRESDARRAGVPVYASLCGWGVSSDGHGGMTRPEVKGQTLAIARAYAKAGFPIDSVRLFEGHGTGTPVGDEVELTAISSLLTGNDARFIGSVKANIGHTKAAAGVAGLIKAAMAVHHGVIPPATACDEPRGHTSLTIASAPLPWPDDAPRRAGVSAFGFGGINAHVALEAPPRATHAVIQSSRQDAELFAIDGDTPDDVRQTLARLGVRAASMSLAELGDAAAALARDVRNRPYRAAFVAATAEELAARASAAGVRTRGREPRIGFLFPGQGSPVRLDGGLWSRRFAHLGIADVRHDPRTDDALTAGGTALAQPAIVATSLAALYVLRALGIEATCAIGHSLGELTALAWAGAFDEGQVLTLAFARGAAMQRLAGHGAMAALPCDAATASALCAHGTVIAAMNAPRQSVIAGSRDAVDETLRHARERGVAGALLPVAAAFHSPSMAAAATDVRAACGTTSPLQRTVISTVTGRALDPHCDVRALLGEQLTSPVRFAEAVANAEVDLFIEAGPGRILTDLAPRAFALDACGASIRPLLECAATLFELGASIDLQPLFANRFTRPFQWQRPRFISNPCCLTPERELPDNRKPATSDQPIASGALAALVELIARQTDLPPEVLRPDSRMLADLHLSSLTVARIVGEAAKAIGAGAVADPTLFANATIEEAAAVLEEIRGRGLAETPLIGGIADWARAFEIVDVPVRRNASAREGTGTWTVHGAEWPALRGRLPSAAGRGAIAVLPSGDDVATLLAAAIAVRDGETFAVVQTRSCGSAFARTLHLERPRVVVRVIDIPSLTIDACDWVARELASADDFVHARYRADGARFEPRARLLAPRTAPAPLFTADDVVLITGGAKGIGAETALHLARTCGARLVLLGRSRDGHDPRLQAEFIAADVTDAESLAEAIGHLPVTAVIHAAGTNDPARIEALDANAFRGVIAPKGDGLRNVLAAVDPERLRLLITFGSLIAHTGMPGEAHYALANEWLARDTEELGRAHPWCRALCIDWTVWSGIGMGQRLGAVETLRNQGVTPLDADVALHWLDEAIAGQATRVIVCGRTGDAPTLRFDAPAPALLRFAEEPRVFYPGVEYVADSVVSRASDPYVDDHRIDGELLLPAVFGLEAMAQLASMLLPSPVATLTNIELTRPLHVPAGGAMRLRVAALRNGDRADAVVRSSATGFAIDHFRATIHASAASAPVPIVIPAPVVADADDAYGPLFFHTGRFRRVRNYRLLGATECIAELDGRDEPWFHRYAPATLVLGDPGLRDAALHALQACVPQALVLPVSVGSIERFDALPRGVAFVSARETAREGADYVFDLVIASRDGRIAERWTSLRLRAVRERDVQQVPPAFWGPYVEREMGLGAPRVAVAASTSDAMARLLSTRNVGHRADGKPLAGNAHVSASRSNGIAMAAVHSTPVGCDLQLIASGAHDFLGHDGAALARLTATEAGENDDLAATRVWSAFEAVKKVAGNRGSSVVFDVLGARRRVGYRCGRLHVSTFAIGEHVVAVAHIPETGGPHA
jgi:enediyne polyketide synthase